MHSRLALILLRGRYNSHLSNRYIALDKSRRNEDALFDYKKSIKIDPWNAITYYFRGKYYC